MISKSKQFYLGVDTGASKSHALITDGRGHVLGFGEGGPGNWESVGWPGTERVLDQIIGQAEHMAGISRAQIGPGGFGLAGYDWPEDREPHVRLLRELGLQGPLALYNDAFVGLPAGAAAGWGVVVSAGTSCNCYGRAADGRLGRLTGNSPYGEYAGAGELVAYALQAIGRAWTRRGPPTRLSEAFVAAVGAIDVSDLLAGLVRGRYSLDAAHAPLVFRVADAGDEVAQQAITWAGQQLGDLVLGVIRQLALQDERFDVVLSGSFFKGSPRLQELVHEVVQSEAPHAQIVRLHAPPVAGSVLLAMELDGPVPALTREMLLSALKLLPLAGEESG
jgi:N-acetylglucosamine kinase-like BadF-type ATPase